MVLHLLMDEKYTSEFISYINNNYNKTGSEHLFMIITKHKELRYPIQDTRYVGFIDQSLKGIFALVKQCFKARRIIVHGLFNHYLVYLLFFTGVSYKVIWGIWGGDLYDYKLEKGFFKFAKKNIIRNFHGVSTHIILDADLARNVYGFKGKHYLCLMYQSCLVAPCNQTVSIHDKSHVYTIMIGNSADITNRHMDILERLKCIKGESVKLILPLSYGSKEYADEVEKEFKSVFGDKVICLKSFLPREEYYKLLSEIDVAVFAHKRQQAVGNITQLLSLGAKIYIDPTVTTYKWLIEMGIRVFNYANLESSIMKSLSLEEKINNNQIICSFANIDALNMQLSELFNE